MERLRKKDAEAGVSTRPITDEQRAAIAEVRSLSDSKIAEQNMSSPANFDASGSAWHPNATPRLRSFVKVQTDCPPERAQ